MLDNTADTQALRNELHAKLPMHMVVRVEAICEGVSSVVVENSRHGTFRLVPTEYHLGRLGSYYIMPHRQWRKTIGQVVSFLLNPPQIQQPDQQSTTSETPTAENLSSPPNMITLPEVEF